MVDTTTINTVKFSQMTNGGDIENNDQVPGLKGGDNVLFNNPWTFLPPGTTAQRPAPSSTINYRLRFNTDDQLYEYYDAVLGAWTQLQESGFTSGPFVIYEADPSIPGAQNLGALANGILKQTVSSGVATLDIAIPITDYYPGGDIDLLNTYKAFNAVDPTNPQDYATKNYVDQNSLTGMSVYAASAGSLGTVTQTGSGVGAQLTNAGVQAALTLDGVNPPNGANVLIKNTATGMTSANEGVYTVMNAGSPTTNWVITRATTYDTPVEINNTGLIIVQNGNTLAGTAWYNTSTIITVDTTAFNYASYGIAIPVPVAAGGTGLTSTTANQLLYSSANNVIAGLPTANNGVLVTSAGGVPSISSTLPSGLTIPSPRITTAILDVNGNIILGMTPTASAVDYVSVVNQIGGSNPGFNSGGTSTNVGMGFNAKGTGQILFSSANTTVPWIINSGTTLQHSTQFSFANTLGTQVVTFPDATGTLLMTGVAINSVPSIAFSSTAGVIATNTNNNADAGSVGEFKSVNIPSGSAVAVTSGNAFNVGFLDLDAGDWDVEGVIGFFPASGTIPTALLGWISTTSATNPNGPNSGAYFQLASAGLTASTFQVHSVGKRRYSFASTTRVYLSGLSIFSVSTMGLFGFMQARRPR